MSLLNDALRNLEKREATDGGDGVSIPAGLSHAGYRTPRYWRWVLGAVALLLATTAGLGFWWVGGHQTVPASKGPVPALDPAPVPLPRPVALEPSPASGGSRTTESTRSGADTEIGTVVPVDLPAKNAESPAATDKPQEEMQTRSSPEPDTEPEPEPEPEAEAVASESIAPNGTKAGQDTTPVRELTPAEKDRRLARKLEELLADGRKGEAADRLRQRVKRDSDVPRSRAVMARHALARENPGEAMPWLPSGAVAMHPELRLLRARVALAREGRASALGWLEREPPGAAAMPAYHTMMAALYQQIGNHDAAAGQWAALIETDDSNARWWAGLGIAMEAQGRSEQARSAYSQALSLPDLAPQLRRYIEQRLAAEQG